MTPERWQQIRDLLASAVCLEPAERSAFLERHCSTDPSLRQELNKLLAVEAQLPSSFLESPAIAQVASQIVSPSASGGLAVGTKLGPYEVQSLFGAGGMGKVYRGRDTRLDRIVAVKVISGSLSSDPLRRQRFEREARAISSLQHPNICTLYDVGSQGGTEYLVMEYLEGETLAERLLKGRLPLDLTLRYAAEVADALDTVHRRGIVHRDLKPGNIFLTTHGESKVLDFGLAKLEEADSLSNMPTLTRPEILTTPGVAMGTVAYMSPEQARGEELDARTDIFSLGAVLYEMATAKVAFPGKTSAITFRAILDETPPPPTQTVPSLPAQLDQIVEKALEKDRDLRYQSAADLRADLQRLKRDSQSGKTAAQRILVSNPTKLPRRVALAAASIVVLLAASLIFVKLAWLRPDSKKAIVQRDVTANRSDNRVFTAAISPDGKQLVYADRANGLFLLQIDTGEMRSFPNTTGMSPRAWFPDGSHLLIVGGRVGPGLWRMSTLDGSMRRLLDLGEGVSPSISPDGLWIAFVKDSNPSELWVTASRGEEPHRILSIAPLQIAEFGWSPTSKRIIFSRFRPISGLQDESALESCDSTGGRRIVALSDDRLHGKNGLGQVRWLADGRVLFRMREPEPNVKYDNLWSLEVDPDTGQASGHPLQITTGIGYTQDNFSASADGKRFAFIRRRFRDDLRIGELRLGSQRMGISRPLSEDEWDKFPVGWARDNQTLIYASDPQGKWGIFQQNVRTRETQSLFTGFDSYEKSVVSADGHWLLFTENPPDARSGSAGHLMRVPLNGGPAGFVLAGNFSYDCASQANLCVLSEALKNKQVFSLLDPARGRGPDVAETEQPFFRWSLSPDGKRIALLLEHGLGKIEILETDGGKSRTIELNDVALQRIGWFSDSQHLCVSGSVGGSWSILRVDLDGKYESIYAVPPGQGWLQLHNVSPDGRYIAYTIRTWETNVALLEHF